jgi:Cu-Zn family superoxide dismutase
MPRKILGSIGALAVTGVLGVAGVAAMTGTASAHGRWAQATLRSADGTRIGTVEFGGDRHSDATEVTVRLRRASAVEAFHGMHIHANNDAVTNGDGCIADPLQPSSTWFVSADGHWKHDPNELHGNHAGDLPSVFVNRDGTATIEYSIDKLEPEEVVGRAVVLHAGLDNFGNVPVGGAADQYVAGSTALAKTQGTGNAGDRFACGVIRSRGN